MRDVTADQLTFAEPRKGLSLFEKYLSVWVILCIVAGIILGKVAPKFARYLDGLSSGAALATVVGVLIEVPVMLMLVRICLLTQNWFPRNLQT